MFKASWDSVVGGMGYIKYGEVIPSAQQSGLVMGTGLNPTLFILLLPFLMYFGYQVSNFFSGEMEDVGKSAPLSSIGELLFCVVANLLPAAAITHMVGQEWWTSASYLVVSGRAAGRDSTLQRLLIISRLDSSISKRLACRCNQLPLVNVGLQLVARLLLLHQPMLLRPCLR